MTTLTRFRISRFNLLMALDTGCMGRSVGTRNRLLMDHVPVTIYTCHIHLLNMHPVADLDLMRDVLVSVLNIPVAIEAILVYEFVFRRILMREYLAGFRMTVDAGHLGWMEQSGPHHDPRLRDMATKTYTWIGHEKMPREKNHGHTDHQGTRKTPKRNHFFLTR